MTFFLYFISYSPGRNQSLRCCGGRIKSAAEGEIYENSAEKGFLDPGIVIFFFLKSGGGGFLVAEKRVDKISPCGKNPRSFSVNKWSFFFYIYISFWEFAHEKNNCELF